MKPTEKLARRICWLEFFPKPPKGYTEAAYWRGVHPDRQAEYIRDAEWLVFIVQRLKPLRILTMVEMAASKRRARR
jgi:hypothetical protein